MLIVLLTAYPCSCASTIGTQSFETADEGWERRSVDFAIWLTVYAFYTRLACTRFIGHKERILVCRLQVVCMCLSSSPTSPSIITIPRLQHKPLTTICQSFGECVLSGAYFACPI